MPDRYFSKDKVIHSPNFTPFSVSWKSPSNIALIKYWGKHGQQLPTNPSISFTLSEAHTIIEMNCELKGDSENQPSLNFLFEGEKKPAFEKRIQSFLNSVTNIFPFLRQLHLNIHSSNSFPHSSGIASSASSMSALALALCDAERQLFGEDDRSSFPQKVSYVSRLASGSACRSVYPVAALWGYSREFNGSSDEYAVPVADHLHPVFHSFKDTILVLSDQAKAVSSSAGHSLMDVHPFAKTRFELANKNLTHLLPALKKGDLETMGKIVENEALMLHALMLTSNPNYILFEPGTIAVIKKVRSFRADTGIPVWFTLDAGPNVHLLYPSEESLKVNSFIEDQLLPYCVPGKSLFDSCGQGPEKLQS